MTKQLKVSNEVHAWLMRSKGKLTVSKKIESLLRENEPKNSSKEENVDKPSIVQSVALTPKDLEMNRPLDVPKHRTQKQREEDGFKRRHSLDFMTSRGRGKGRTKFDRD